MLFPLLAFLGPVFAGFSAVRFGTTALVVATPLALRSTKKELEWTKNMWKRDRTLHLTPERNQLDVTQGAILEAPFKLGREMTEDELHRLEATSLKPEIMAPKEISFPSCSEEFQALANGKYFLTEMEWCHLRAALHDLMIWWKEPVDDVKFLEEVAAKAGVTYDEIRGAASEPIDYYGGSVNIRILKELSRRRLQDEFLMRAAGQEQKAA